jgi:MinD superfamily P-loop ATPase
MKEIVILSGKGGVGKSTITASLGTILSKDYKVVMADTDVDLPNLGLFFPAAERESKEIATSEKAFIDYEQCTGCLQCVDVCRFSSMVASDNNPLVISYSCEGCGACAVICPADAIAIKKVMNGSIIISDANNMVIVSGELSIGESSSGGIVDEVRKTARKEAERLNADLIMTDGPPGIGCPVISSMKGSSYVIAVTEPTPAALNDLERLAEVIHYFNIPSGLVINKSDMHPGGIQTIKHFVQRNIISVLSEIPYDIHILKAIAEARPVVTAYPEAPSSIAIRILADKLKNIIKESD